ncbi:MAG TPA: ATP synthase subunit I [Pyrinomonadaceae bacterium]
MTDIADNTVDTSVQIEEDLALKTRIFRAMVVVTGVAVIVSAFVSPWRVTTGLLIGGVLALFSHRWLSNSAAAAIRLSSGGIVQPVHLVQFILRYVVVTAAVFAASEVGWASLTAMLVGLSSFVVALFVEAIREFYFAIIQREEIS